MSDPYQGFFERLFASVRMLITCLLSNTANDLVVENAVKNLNENQLKRYVYEKMYYEPPPNGLWR